MRWIKIITLAIVCLSHLLYVQAAEVDCSATPMENGCYAGLPAAQYQLLLDEMVSRATPVGKAMATDESEVFKYAFRSLNNGQTTLYSGPNGQQIGTIAGGAKYVTTMDYQAGWVMVQPNEWVRESDTTIVQPSVFAGMHLTPESLNPYTLAWVLLPEYPAAYPGAEGDRSRTRYERYTPVTIFAEAEADGLIWYLVGPESWIVQTSIGKVVLAERPEGVKGRWVSADLYEQVLVAYEDDTPVFATLMSSGQPQYPTDQGTFRTYLRMTADKMSGAAGRDDFYNVDYVPWVLYYEGNFAIHAVYWHDKFGYRASRGCLGLSLTDAKWLFNWTNEGGYELPYVHVFSSGQYVGE